jgi:alpha-maltose-1-phosphate synthase
VKVALLMGNRFNPWHLGGFLRMDGVSLTGFRAESEIQAYFDAQGADRTGLRCESIHFDTQAGPPWRRIPNRLAERWGAREPRILPFAHRLQGVDLSISWELHTDWTAAALDAQARYGVPAVVTVWDTLPFNNEADPRRRALKERARAEARRFVVYTGKSRAVLQLEGVEPERIAFVTPGVDTEAFAPGGRNRSAWGIEEDAFVIFFVGWMLPRKGLPVLAQALAHWLRDAPPDRPVKLLVAADGPGKTETESLFRQLQLMSHVRFAGSVSHENMPDLFRASDCFVLPSLPTPTWEEQFGMSLIEAMAAGVPSVSTYSGAIPEIASDAALLVPPGDFVALADALNRLERDPDLRRALSEASRRRALERFALERHIGDWRRVMDAAVGSP